MVLRRGKVEWKYAKITCGVQCVTMDGPLQMQELYADN